MNDEEFNKLITTSIITLLESDVPTSIVAKAFNIDTLTVRGLLADLRVRKYGSSEIAELLQGLMFEAYEEAVRSIRYGNPAIKSRMIGLVLSKALALVGKQSPEEFERMRADMQNLLQDVVTDTSEAPSLYADSEFSPVDGDEED